MWPKLDFIQNQLRQIHSQKTSQSLMFTLVVLLILGAFGGLLLLKDPLINGLSAFQNNTFPTRPTHR